MNGLEILQVIHTRLERRGMGKSEDDPIRIIEQYWLMDGTLLFEYDPHTGHVYSQVHPFAGGCTQRAI
jgi:hypothetical protein